MFFTVSQDSPVHVRLTCSFSKPQAQAWTPPPPPLGTPNLITGLPAELRNKIYDLALADKEHEKIVLFECPFKDSRTYEPSLLLTCKQLRHEAGYVWYSTRVFSMNLSIDPPKMACTLRKLEGIISRHGPGAFKKGITFRLLPSAERTPKGIIDLADLVSRTGALLLPSDIRDDILAYGMTVSVYASFQVAMCGHDPGTSVITFLLLGLVAHREGWSYVRLLREMRRHDTAVKKGLKVGQVGGGRRGFLLLVPVGDTLVFHIPLCRRAA